MKNIKEMRRSAGLTQQQLSDLLGIPRRTIGNWETGVNKCPEYLLNLIEYFLKHEKLI